jgi:nicotinamidase/pyrazinamidase
MEERALIIVDLQQDLSEGGPMATQNFLEIVPIINGIKNKFKIIIFTKNCYPPDHKIFSKNIPQHCVDGTQGSRIHQGVLVNNPIYIKRGMTKTSILGESAFYVDKGKNIETNLSTILKSCNIKDIYICGISLEGSIFRTILDAYKLRYNCKLIIDATTCENKEKGNKCKKFLKTIGVQIVNSNIIFY